MVEKKVDKKISVIMPVYEAEKYIDEAIESILNQTYRKFELIIIDDCGHDDSMRHVERFKDERIRVIKNACNLGIAGARNVGIENAKGEYIALMDDDDIAPEERFKLEVEYLENHPDVDVVGGGGFWIDENGDVISESELIICNPKRIKAELLFQDVIENGSAMFRKDFVMKNNIRYQDGYLGMEDYKFWTECSAKGKISNLSVNLLFWRKTSESETSRVQKDLVIERKKKFAEIQCSLIKEYGFDLSEEELKIFTDCFEEDKRGRLGREELNDVYRLINKMLIIAKNLKIDYYDEFQLVLRRRFAQKLEYGLFWDDGNDLFLKG